MEDDNLFRLLREGWRAIYRRSRRMRVRVRGGGRAQDRRLRRMPWSTAHCGNRSGRPRRRQPHCPFKTMQLGAEKITVGSTRRLSRMVAKVVAGGTQISEERRHHTVRETRPQPLSAPDFNERR
jgi:hypothetical protein